MSKLSKEQVREAISDSGGIISRIARACGVDWHTANDFISADKELKLLLDCENQEILDQADSALYGAINQGEAWVLSTKGKHRGYVEKQEIRTEMTFTDFVKRLAAEEGG